MQPRILDLGQNITGPVAASWLAAVGAEVIKVEQPRIGDNSRVGPPFLGKDGVRQHRQDESDVSISFLKRNRGKKSITLNIASTAGRKVLDQLVAVSDALVMNYRPETVAKLDLGFERLSAVNPKLVACYITGFGTDGPWQAWSAYDGIIQAASGAMAHNGFQEQPPVKIGITVGDHTGASFAAIGILAALLRRGSTGPGQAIEVSMIDCLMSLLWDEPLDFFERSGRGERKGNASPRAVPWNAYVTSDGYVTISALTREQWLAIAEIVGIDDAASLIDMGARLAQKERIDGAITRWTSERPKLEVASVLQAKGVPCGPVLNATEVMNSDHVRVTGKLRAIQHPDLGAIADIVAPEFPLRKSFPSAASWRRAPNLGEHNDEVYRDLIGLSSSEIDAFRAQGVI